MSAIIEPMTPRELRYLVGAAHTRNFGQAAKACFVTQPTASTRIKKLEERLGAALLERTNKSVEVMPTGRKIDGLASGVIEQCEQIEEAAAPRPRRAAQFEANTDSEYNSSPLSPS
jgi:LysR family hydrogen peroxide-inducible transcriptional activator